MRAVRLPLPVVEASIKPFYRLALDARLPVRVQRALLDLAAPIQTLPDGTVVERTTLAGRPAERITVGATERRHAVLYLHGGAYTIGSLGTHRSLAAYLARESASAVYTLDYRLARSIRFRPLSTMPWRRSSSWSPTTGSRPIGWRSPAIRRAAGWRSRRPAG